MSSDAAQPPASAAKADAVSVGALDNTKPANDLPVEGKWPRGWRLLFIVGSCLLFWLLVAFHWF